MFYIYLDKFPVLIKAEFTLPVSKMPQETCFIPVDVSTGPSPPHARVSSRWMRRKTSKSDTFKCLIYLPDGSDFNHLVPKKATGRELLDYVFWRIDLREKEYFGLKFTNKNGMKVWLDPAGKIRKQVTYNQTNINSQCFMLLLSVIVFRSQRNS